MRTLYVLGLVLLDIAILLLGAVVIAITDLDKQSGLGALRTLPTLLLVLPHFTVAHYALSPRGNEDEDVRRTARRTTLLLAASFAAERSSPTKESTCPPRTLSRATTNGTSTRSSSKAASRSTLLGASMVPLKHPPPTLRFSRSDH